MIILQHQIKFVNNVVVLLAKVAKPLKLIDFVYQQVIHVEDVNFVLQLLHVHLAIGVII